MKKIIVAAVLLTSFFSAVSYAQSSEEVRRQILKEDREREQRAAQQRQRDEELGFGRSSRETAKQRIAREAVENIYRKPTSEELELIAPNKSDAEKHAEFLKQKNTGLIKLVADTGCADNPYVLDAAAKCQKYTMPGAGASYSFRFENYRIPKLADLTLKNGFFLTSGTSLQGILVKLGDVSLETVNLQSEGLQFIKNFKPEKDYEKVSRWSEKINRGIKADGFLYDSSSPVAENATYALRVIAYKGKIPRSVQGFVYDEAAWDKRKDMIIAFRVVRVDQAGSVTILWKELSSRGAPKLKIAKSSN